MTPIVLGGDHSIALGTLGGLASVYGPGGVLWLDAHGDLTRRRRLRAGTSTGCRLPPPSARSAVVRQRRLAAPGTGPERVVLLGVRSLDEGERAFVRESGIGVYP